MPDEERRPQRVACRRVRAGEHILRWEGAEILNRVFDLGRRDLLHT
jgi:hypothetical protein